MNECPIRVPGVHAQRLRQILLMDSFDGTTLDGPIVSAYRNGPDAVEVVQFGGNACQADPVCQVQGQHLGVDHISGDRIRRMRHLHDPGGRRAGSTGMPYAIDPVQRDLRLHAGQRDGLDAARCRVGRRMSISQPQPLTDFAIVERDVLTATIGHVLLDRLEHQRSCGVAPVTGDQAEGVVRRYPDIDRVVDPGVAFWQEVVDEYRSSPGMRRGVRPAGGKQVGHHPRIGAPPIVGLPGPAPAEIFMFGQLGDAGAV